MTVWLDAQLPPALAPWLTQAFSIEANAVRDLGLHQSTDEIIFAAAKKAAAIVMTKDRDFLGLLEQFGPPPRVIWITCGNTSNAHLKEVLLKTFPSALKLLEAGEPLVEISDPW